MSDARFDRDLAEVLREIAGEEAPMSLRFRLSDITERAPIGRRLWFATPMRLSMVAAAVAAVLALAIIFLPRETVGPTPSDSPSIEPTRTVEPTPAPTVEPTAAPTTEPTTGPTPVTTPVPTSTGEWTGLVWSEPVTPSFTVHLYDLVPWTDGYVAVGEVPGQGPWASFTSPDGLHWTIEQADFPGAPRHLVTLGDELLAFMPEVWPDNTSAPGTAIGAPLTTLVWRSTDGVAWTLVDSPSWQDAWHGAVPDAVAGTYPDGWNQPQHDVPLGVAGVASGPDGLVAIGNSFGDDALEPIILHSSDGVTWTSSGLPEGSDSAVLNSVVEHDGRFVITGATDVWTDPTTARPAAWYSDNGVAWTRASVDDGGIGPGTGTEFGPLAAGADGLLTCRGNREMGAGGWRYMLEWVSTDGTSWAPAASLDENPGCNWAAGDGTRIVSLGPRAHATPYEWPGVTIAWTTTDGENWQELTVSSTLGDMLERFWVVPDGVIFAGEQSFWFGSAVER